MNCIYKKTIKYLLKDLPFEKEEPFNNLCMNLLSVFPCLGFFLSDKREIFNNGNSFLYKQYHFSPRKFKVKDFDLTIIFKKKQFNPIKICFFKHRKLIFTITFKNNLNAAKFKFFGKKSIIKTTMEELICLIILAKNHSNYERQERN